MGTFGGAVMLTTVRAYNRNRGALHGTGGESGM